MREILVIWLVQLDKSHSQIFSKRRMRANKFFMVNIIHPVYDFSLLLVRPNELLGIQIAFEQSYSNILSASEPGLVMWTWPLV